MNNWKRCFFYKHYSVKFDYNCSIGLSAISLADALSLIASDFPDKLVEFEQMIKNSRANQSKPSAEPPEVPPAADTAAADRIRTAARSEELERRRKQAMEAAAEYNRRLMLERRTTRSHVFDTQTWTLHGSRREAALRAPPADPKEAAQEDDEARDKYFPVALLRGQYQSSVRRFSPAELRRLPFASVLELAPSGGALVRRALLSSLASAQHPEHQLPQQQQQHLRQAEVSELQSSIGVVPDGTDAAAAASAALDASAKLHDEQSHSQRPVCYLCGEPSLSPAGPPLIQCSLCERVGHPLASCFGITEIVAQRALKYSTL